MSTLPDPLREQGILPAFPEFSCAYSKGSFQTSYEVFQGFFFTIGNKEQKSKHILCHFIPGGKEFTLK